MPKVSPIEQIVVPGFAAGMNTEADPLLLGEGESPLLENVDLALGGAVETRGGSQNADDEVDTAVNDFLDVYWEAGATPHFIMQRDGNGIRHATTTTISTHTTTFGTHNNRYDWNRPVVTYAGNAYVTNAISTANAPREFDGTTWTSLGKFDGVDVTAHFPLASSAVVKNERVYVANVLYASGTAHSSRVHWSNALLPKSWDAADYVDFDPDDGEQITAIYPYAEDLIVFKDSKIYVLTGRSPAEHSVWGLARSLGTRAPRTVQEVNGILFFFDESHGVYAFDGGAFTLVSEKINSELLGGINQSKAYVASAFSYDNKYYLSVPWGTDTRPTRTYVFDTELQAWVRHTVGYAGGAVVNRTPYGVGVAQEGESGSTGYSTLLVAGIADHGTSFNARVRTPWLVPGGTASKGRMRRADLAFAGGGGDTVLVRLYRDFYNEDPYKSYVVDTTGSGSLWGTAVWGTDPWGGAQEQVLVRKQGWGKRWLAFQFEVRATYLNPFQLNRMAFIISTNQQVHGERN